MSKIPTENPRLLLDHVINLIARDIKFIYQMGEHKKLHHNTASDLVRYSGALLQIIKDFDNQNEDFKKQLQSLSTEDLLKKAEIAFKELKKIDT